MARIAATSDLHFDPYGYLTPPDKIAQIIGQIGASGAQAMVVAGDIGHPLANYQDCIACLATLGLPCGVVPGNHDVWQDPDFDSEELWLRVLPEVARTHGLTWLEADPLIIDGLAIVGSLVWYDYSAADPALGLGPNDYASLKRHISNDARWINWRFTDPQAAAHARQKLVGMLEACEDEPSIDRVMVVTHVPMFAQHLPASDGDPTRSIAKAFFANLQTGRDVLSFPKVRAVVSGHLHTPMDTVVRRRGMADVRAVVVGSDYGSPGWTMLDV